MAMETVMDWEELRAHRTFVLRRSGRYLVADLRGPHRALSTSARNGGEIGTAGHLLNHQSCEGAGHHDRHRAIGDAGPSGYHNRVCAEAGLPADRTLLMGTAANMHYAAIVTEADGDVEVTAVVTAGVEGNATCAGDPAHWRETASGTAKVPEYAGTINTMLLIDTPVTPATLVRAAMTMTEGKSAALQRLAVPSRQSPDLATGTGTDQACLAAPSDGAWTLTSASSHVKLGELIGLAARRATIEALRWQNGLEASYTRGLFHALGRYGVHEATLFADIESLLDAADLELLRRNGKAVFYEPLVGAAAHAMAAVLDRVRHGALPGSIARDATVQQAATLAVSLAAQPHRWAEFRSRLHGTAGETPKALALAALALGWSEKWRGL
jgi:adenosylcobinamide amidohydrolase